MIRAICILVLIEEHSTRRSGFLKAVSYKNAVYYRPVAFIPLSPGSPASQLAGYMEPYLHAEGGCREYY